MPSARARLALILSAVLGLLAACGGAPQTDAGATAAQPTSTLAMPGVTRGKVFLPKFQRWHIFGVEPLPGVKVPASLANLPTNLRGMHVYFGAGYMTMPDVANAGDQLFPACFARTSIGLQVQPVSAASAADPAAVGSALVVRAVGDGQLRVSWGKLFDLKLAQDDLPTDDGYQQRVYDRYYNMALASALQDGVKPRCTLEPVSVPPLVDHDLDLVAPASGRHLVAPGDDRDPETPLAATALAGNGWRRLDSAEPANTVAGCTGDEFVTRLVSVPMPGVPGRNDYYIVGTLAGQAANGDTCRRTRLVRRIEPGKLLELAGVPLAAATSVDPRGLNIELEGWQGDSVFRARVGGYRFELAAVNQPQVQVTLIGQPAGVEVTGSEPAAATAATAATTHAAATAPAAAATQPNRSGSAPLPAAAANGPATSPPQGARPGRVQRWVDDKGVVHFSDRPGSP